VTARRRSAAHAAQRGRALAGVKLAAAVP